MQNDNEGSLQPTAANGASEQSETIEVPSSISQPINWALTPGIRHHILKNGVDEGFLEQYLQRVKEVFSPQSVAYDSTSYAAARWTISCFMEYKKGVARGKITLSETLLDVSQPVLGICDGLFAQWRATYMGAPLSTKYERQQSFITRYRATGLETHLPKHIDGGDVDGSLILQLPTDAPFTGGGLTIWDGPDAEQTTKYVYALEPGEICFLDAQVWHQSNPVLSGERWVLVVFYRQQEEAKEFVPYVDPHSGKVIDAKVHAARRALGNRFKAALKLQNHTNDGT